MKCGQVSAQAAIARISQSPIFRAHPLRQHQRLQWVDRWPTRQGLGSRQAEKNVPKRIQTRKRVQIAKNTQMKRKTWPHESISEYQQRGRWHGKATCNSAALPDFVNSSTRYDDQYYLLNVTNALQLFENPRLRPFAIQHVDVLKHNPYNL